MDVAGITVEFLWSSSPHHAAPDIVHQVLGDLSQVRLTTWQHQTWRHASHWFFLLIPSPKIKGLIFTGSQFLYVQGDRVNEAYYFLDDLSYLILNRVLSPNILTA